MQKDIRKTLERSLPQYVLDYLNDEFSKLEKYEQRCKAQEEKIEWLMEDLAQKDQVLYRVLSNGRGYGNSPSIGFAYGQEQPERSFDDIYARRSRRADGTFMETTYTEPYMAQGGQSQGGGQAQGQGGSQTGGGGSTGGGISSVYDRRGGRRSSRGRPYSTFAHYGPEEFKELKEFDDVYDRYDEKSSRYTNSRDIQGQLKGTPDPNSYQSVSEQSQADYARQREMQDERFRAAQGSPSQEDPAQYTKTPNV